MPSVTFAFSVMVPPNWISRMLPSVALIKRKETLHVYGASGWVSWHSVGYLIQYSEVMGS